MRPGAKLRCRVAGDTAACAGCYDSRDIADDVAGRDLGHPGIGSSALSSSSCRIRRDNRWPRQPDGVRPARPIRNNGRRPAGGEGLVSRSTAPCTANPRICE